MPLPNQNVVKLILVEQDEDSDDTPRILCWTSGITYPTNGVITRPHIKTHLGLILSSQASDAEPHRSLLKLALAKNSKIVKTPDGSICINISVSAFLTLMHATDSPCGHSEHLNSTLRELHVSTDSSSSEQEQVFITKPLPLPYLDLAELDELGRCEVLCGGDRHDESAPNRPDAALEALRANEAY
jgi:hypothetical protein